MGSFTIKLASLSSHVENYAWYAFSSCIRLFVSRFLSQTFSFFLSFFFLLFFLRLRYNISWGSGKLKLRFTLEEELILPMSVRIFLLSFFFPPTLFVAHFPPPPVVAGIQESLGLDHPKFRNPSHPPAADLEP